MCSFKYKNIIQLFVCFVVFFSFNIDVFAQVKQSSNTNLYTECVDSNMCVPICIYSCQDDSDICYYANESNNHEFLYIGHYYNKEYQLDEDSIKKVWSLGMLESTSVPLLGKSSQLHLWTYDNLPEENLYFSNTERSQEWKGTSSYNNVSNNFICPTYVDMASDSYVFFSDDNSSSDAKLSYSFIDEFEVILKDAELESEMFDLKYEDINKNDRVKEFLKILKIAGINDTFDSSLSSDENIKKFCDATNATDAKNYVNKIDIEKMVNAIFSMSLENKSVRYPQVYNYSNLQSLLVSSVGNDIVDANGKSYIDRINSLYKDINSNMITYLNEDCNWNLSEQDLNQAITEKLESITHELVTPNFDEKFDCDTLFGGDIAKIISGAYFLIEMVALALLIVFTVIDYAKAILNGEADEVKKCNQKLIKRLIIVVVLFLLPAIINTVLGIFHIEGFNSDHPLCIDISNK